MITIMPQQVVIDHYERVCQVSGEQIVLELWERCMEVQGADLQIMAMERDELVISGRLCSLEFYEKA